MALKRLKTNYGRPIGVALLTMILFGSVLLAFAQQTSKPTPLLRITTKALPKATVGVEYYAVIAAAGGEPPYDCTGKGLPANIVFHPSSDTLGGKPTTPGTYPVVITVEDSADPQHTATANFMLTVAPAK